MLSNTQYVKINDCRTDTIVTFTQIKVKVEKPNRSKLEHESVFDRSIATWKRGNEFLRTKTNGFL